MRLCAFARTLLFISLLIPGSADAQVCHNLYPSPEIATYDNNGNDLRGFIHTNKKDLLAKGSQVNEYSKNIWGYLQVRSVSVPSVDKEGKLNYSEPINVTLAMYKTTDGAEATWWARQCNSPQGPLIDMKVAADSLLDMDYVRYPDIMRLLDTDRFTIVEYSGDTYNSKDFDDLIKNYVLIKNGTVKSLYNYDVIIKYYNNFLSKFSYVEDPLLEYKSFITCFTSGNTKFIGCFNVVNNKLAGTLETVNIVYEHDKAAIVNAAFKKLTGSVVYVYGDDIFGMQKEINTYSREHNIKVIRRTTDADKDFNKEYIHEQ